MIVLLKYTDFYSSFFKFKNSVFKQEAKVSLAKLNHVRSILKPNDSKSSEREIFGISTQKLWQIFRLENW